MASGKRRYRYYSNTAIVTWSLIWKHSSVLWLSFLHIRSICLWIHFHVRNSVRVSVCQNPNLLQDRAYNVWNGRSDETKNIWKRNKKREKVGPKNSPARIVTVLLTLERNMITNCFYFHVFENVLNSSIKIRIEESWFLWSLWTNGPSTPS